MCALKEIEDTAIAKADAVIFPSDTLKSYVLDSRCRPRVLTVPHSFDPALYPESANFTFPAAAAGKLRSRSLVIPIRCAASNQLCGQ
ncbi:hypothetical protein RQN30_11975 [Arcanobacterium hippocoleae]